MPLTPSSLIPGTSPLPTPGQQPPNKRALRLAALLALPFLALTLVGGDLLLPRILFLAPGLQAQASGSAFSNGGSPVSTFQGFVYPWTRNLSGGGYSTPASLQNMQSEAHTFHMNAVIIPVVADMPLRDDSVLLWHATDNGDINTLPDSDYQQAITDAKKAGLMPILELQVRQHDALSPNDSSQFVGWFWSYSVSNASTNDNGKIIHAAQTERQWFDNYALFAVHYAQMSQQYHLPYFIIGSDLTSTTYDTNATVTKADPQGIDHGVPGETCNNATGRRECEWRHVVRAIRQISYSSLSTHQSQTGGNYTGKLIYEASWGTPLNPNANGATQSEYSSITWWDAVDYIGVDAEFPLTATGSDVDLADLENAWNGLKTPYGDGGSGNIVNNLGTLYNKFQRPIVFTTASYASAVGANTGQPSGNQDNNEQLVDVQALLGTFEGEPWWEGAFWSADYPIAPRSSQPHWDISSNWAGDNLSSSKPAGQWLAGHYHDNPLS